MRQRGYDPARYARYAGSAYPGRTREVDSGRLDGCWRGPRAALLLAAEILMLSIRSDALCAQVHNCASSGESWFITLPTVPQRTRAPKGFTRAIARNTT
jgi:hypothetical protein